MQCGRQKRVRGQVTCEMGGEEGARVTLMVGDGGVGGGRGETVTKPKGNHEKNSKNHRQNKANDQQRRNRTDNSETIAREVDVHHIPRERSHARPDCPYE
jgi:hypothetical protein